MMGRVIAIDGPSGSGKSTVAMHLAKRIGFHYLDTGALYRALALGLREKAGLDESASDDELQNALNSLDVAFESGHVLLDGQDVEDRIRTTESGHFSSVFSTRAPVRAMLLPVQKNAALMDDLVAEGRDMGTVVFPDAWVKIFLTASVEARALRRYKQLLKKGLPVTEEQALQDIVLRDERDSTRDLAPLKADEDALIIDSSDMDVEGVIELILNRIQQGA